MWRGAVVAGSGCRGGRSSAAAGAAEATGRVEALSGCNGCKGWRGGRGERPPLELGRSCAASAAESRAAGAVFASGGCCRGGRSCAAGAAESRAARTSAALFGGGVVFRAVQGRPHVAPTGGCRVVCSWLVWWLGCQRGRPLLGVFARLVWAALVWGAEYCCQARGDAARRPAWLGVRAPPWCPGPAWWACWGGE